MESFFASVKKELVHHEDYATRGQARASIFAYIEALHNRARRRPALRYVAPPNTSGRTTRTTAAQSATRTCTGAVYSFRTRASCVIVYSGFPSSVHVISKVLRVAPIDRRPGGSFSPRSPAAVAYLPCVLKCDFCA